MSHFFSRGRSTGKPSAPTSGGGPDSPKTTRTADTWAIIALLVLAVIALRGPHFRTARAGDYYQFWVVGQAIRSADVFDIYSSDDRKAMGRAFLNRALESKASRAHVAAARRWRRLEPTATPFQYAIFDIISTGNYDRDYQNFRAALMMFSVLGFYALARACSVSPLFSFAFAVFGVTFWPSRADLNYGNITRLQVALAAVYLFTLKWRDNAAREIASGAVLGFAFFFKPSIVYVLPILGLLWIGQREWRRMYRAGIGFAGIGLIAWLLPTIKFGSACSWWNWFLQVPRMAYRTHYVNDSLPAILFDTNTIAVHRSLALITVLLLGYLYWRTAPARGEEMDPVFRWRREAFTVAFGMGLYLVLDPFVHGQYFVLVLPLGAILISPWPSGHEAPGWLRFRITGAIIALALMASNPQMRWHTARSHDERFANFGGVLILIMLGVMEIRRMSSAGSPKKNPPQTHRGHGSSGRRSASSRSGAGD